MPTRDQVRQLLEQGHDYPEIARRLGVPPGQVYLIGTGMPADGGDTYTDAERQRPGALPTAQHLLGLGAEDPTTTRPPTGATGVEALSGVDPFVMQADGRSWLFVPAGLTDGPLPTHYEPQESP